MTTTSVEFCQQLRAHGIDFFTSVPCSIFKKVIAELDGNPEITYVPAVREDTAVGLAVGAFLAGRRPMVLIQNSGLGVCLNSLASLAMIYEIPLLLLVSWRGYLGQDAPEHIVMGAALTGVIEKIGMDFRILEADSLDETLEEALLTMNRRRMPLALILRDGILT